MREIKFRAWDGELMHNVSELHFCMGPRLDGKGLKFYGPGVGQGWIDGKKVHLMQYTGLKDNNDVEIYEGDVCTIWMGVKQDKPYVVEDLRELYSDMNHADRYYRITRIEVIGNKYENPELM
ncbi:hypothetical protein CVD25_00955 [Bacillus canaveralius]|uniref:YopX protein domain-containing protein n=1 Tax=Bacillus canaveralius TaxID=1403243 RepID=A0A2N5GPJ4_9BACI|nr:YopX family protein [Bacillus canaveralius]PLR84635.1 hypothetical protein CU635_06065 [Bacillus canaveralius]PLS00787.1 hypothetical protein CVD25_00955 [Bacillus canaveralius]